MSESCLFDRARLATVQLALPTPFSPDGGELVPDSLARLVRLTFPAGIRVFLPAAGTGEFHSLTADEVLTCVRVTRETVGNEAIVLAPVGLGIGHALAIGRGAADLGADALLVMPAVHPYLSDAGFHDYFQALAAHIPLPILVYKKGPVPSTSLLLTLAQQGRLVGVKYAVNDLDEFVRFSATVSGQVGLYCGTSERFAPFFMLAGAEGYTSGAGVLCPRLTLALHRALTVGDYAGGMKLMALIRPIEDFRAQDNDSFSISFLKAALQLAGIDFGPPRPPQRRLTAEERAQIARLIEPILQAEQGEG